MLIVSREKLRFVLLQSETCFIFWLVCLHVGKMENDFFFLVFQKVYGKFLNCMVPDTKISYLILQCSPSISIQYKNILGILRDVLMSYKKYWDHFCLPSKINAFNLPSFRKKTSHMPPKNNVNIRHDIQSTSPRTPVVIKW